jgi:CRP-like cAMP-binding protein
MQKIANSENISKVLKERQIRALPIILSAKNLEAGCREAGITSTTFRQWLSEYPEFQEAVNDGRRQIAEEAMTRLKSSMGKAIDRLVLLVDSESEEVSRKAATSLITFALELRESEEIEERIESIEKIVFERRTYR